VVVTQEPPSTRVRETAIDIEWSGALAPESGLVVYQAPDSREAPLLFAFHEAVTRGDVGVVTDSFAHRETAVTRPLREAYDTSALIAAALGITVVAASGDSARTDVPSSSPHVTAVGGTDLVTNAGEVVSEICWAVSGSGDALSFDRPLWQPGTFARRAVADVAMAAGVAYWVYYLGDWELNGGTSFASPVFSAAIALVNQRRALDGKPPAGFLNPLLYRDAEVQATFRDVTTGGTDLYPCGPGWDRPSGWGAPNVAALADALP
jgi:kumamolisin